MYTMHDALSLSLHHYKILGILPQSKWGLGSICLLHIIHLLMFSIQFTHIILYIIHMITLAPTIW